MRDTIVAFTTDEVVVADTSVSAKRPGIMVEGLGYERAETDGGELMFAVLARTGGEIVAALGLPERDVPPGAVHIEQAAGGGSSTSPPVVHSQSGREYVIVAGPERTFVIAADAHGTFEQTRTAPGETTVHVDGDDEIVFAAFRYDADGDWWSWLEGQGLFVFPSLVPPLVYLQRRASPPVGP